MMTQRENHNGQNFKVELISEIKTDNLDIYAENAVDKVYYIAALTNPVLSQKWVSNKQIKKMLFRQDPFWGFTVETVKDGDEDFIIGSLF